MSGLSIIVVSWNTRDLTLDCISHATHAAAQFTAETNEPAELILVDNGSEDSTVESVGVRHSAVRIVRLPHNRGFAAGANAGLAAAGGDILLWLNSDTRIGPSALLACWRRLASRPATAIVAPQLLHEDGRLQNSAHAFPALLDEILPGWLLDWVWPRRRPAKRSVGASPRSVDAVQGAVLFVRRSVLDAVGPFSEEYFFYLEETDLCWRMREAGYDVELLPAARVVHVSGVSSKRVDSGASRIEFHRSLYRFLRARRGHATMRVAIALRTVRGIVTVPLLGLARPLSARLRQRHEERSALLRWHLAGRPAEPGLAQVAPLSEATAGSAESGCGRGGSARL